MTGTRSEVDPQTVVDVTVGAKTQLMDRRLTLNGNVFWDKYRNLQTSVFNGLEFITQAAGGFEAKGFEVDAEYRFMPSISVNGSYTYSKTEFTDYVTACPTSIQAAGAAAIAAQCNAPGSNAANPLYQAKGQPLAGAPKHSVTLRADYGQPFGQKRVLDGSVNYYFRSRVNYDVGNTNAVQAAYGTVGATIGIGESDGRWRVALFGRNIFDKRFVSSVINLPFSDPGGAVNWQTREGRRTIGASVDIRFQ